jgi:hypothetical protein
MIDLLGYNIIENKTGKTVAYVGIYAIHDKNERNKIFKKYNPKYYTYAGVPNY